MKYAFSPYAIYSSLLDGIAAVKYLTRQSLRNTFTRSGKRASAMPQWLPALGIALVLAQAIPGMINESQAAGLSGGIRVQAGHNASK
jgi:hypothetical protein